jgi:hypothetical protein
VWRHFPGGRHTSGHLADTLNAPVRFEVLPGCRGDGTFDGAASAEVLSDAAGRAGAPFKGTRRGLVRLRVSSFAATSAVNTLVVVEGGPW